MEAMKYRIVQRSVIHSVSLHATMAAVLPAWQNATESTIAEIIQTKSIVTVVHTIHSNVRLDYVLMRVHTVMEQGNVLTDPMKKTTVKLYVVMVHTRVTMVAALTLTQYVMDAMIAEITAMRRTARALQIN